ncbi:unnamed protein product [Choristocarpus tenellus]
MSSKLAKRMLSRVDDMVLRASEAAGSSVVSGKRKKVARSLLDGPNKRDRVSKVATGGGHSAVAKSSSSKKVRKKQNERPRSLLEEAQMDLVAKEDQFKRNMYLINYGKKWSRPQDHSKLLRKTRKKRSKMERMREGVLRLVSPDVGTRSG